MMNGILRAPTFIYNHVTLGLDQIIIRLQLKNQKTLEHSCEGQQILLVIKH